MRKTRIWDIKGNLIVAFNIDKAIEMYRQLTNKECNIIDVKMVSSSSGSFDAYIQ